MKFTNKGRFFNFTLCVLVIFEVVQIFLMHIYTYRILNSDMSSELILARLLSQEGKIMSSNWYYSTELRVLGMQIIDSVLFRFSDNWHLVRMCGTVIMHIITIGSIFCFCKAINLLKVSPLLSIILLMPVSVKYYDITLFGNYYMPFMAISFFVVSLIVSYVNSKHKILLFISGALSFVFCLGGPRPLLIIYIPTLLVALFGCVYICVKQNELEPKRYQLQKAISLRFACITLINFALGFAGFFANTHILARWFTFHIWKLNFILFNGNRFLQALTGFLSNYGYRTGPLKASTIIPNAAALILFAAVLASVYYAIKHSDKVTKLFYGYSLCFTAMVLVFASLYSFTDMVYDLSYSLPIMVFSWFEIAFFIKESRLESMVKKTFSVALILTVLTSGICSYHQISKYQATTYQLPIANYG